MSELIKSLINSVMDELKSVAKAEVVMGKEIEFDVARRSFLCRV